MNSAFEDSDNPRVLDLNDLRIFAHVADSGGFASAARLLDMSKSTVSTAIARLEEKLGVMLFLRTRGGVSLTPAGQRLLIPTRRGLVELEGVEVVRRSLREEPSGLLRVAAPMTFTREYLAPTFPELYRRYRKIELEIELTNRMFDVLAGDVDVLLTTTPPADPDIVVQQFSSSSVHFYASPEYLHDKPWPTTIDDVLSWHLLCVGRGQGARTWRVHGPDGERVVAVTPRLVVNDPVILRDLACHGLGGAWLPSRLCAELVEQGALRRLLPDWRMPAVGFFVVRAGQRSILPNIRAFVEFVSQELGSPAWQAVFSAAR